MRPALSRPAAPPAPQLYGSLASSFDARNSDMDVALVPGASSTFARATDARAHPDDAKDGKVHLLRVFARFLRPLGSVQARGRPPRGSGVPL